jgi:small subunit ribosomal protein S1
MEAQMAKTVETLERKEKLTGKVEKIMLAGAIVDLGLDVPGVIHISQLQKEPVNKIEDVLEVGQEISAWVKRIPPKKDRVELTMIEPLPLEWREIKEGMVIKGTVTRLEKYGAFVEIGAERPGLVHISELAHGYIRTPGEAVQEGEEIEVKVLSINRRKKQIKLSVKQLMENPAKVVQQAKKEEEEEEQKPIPTAMEMALREAMEKTQQDNGEDEERKPAKRSAANNNEMEDILSRTLENQVKT